MLNENDHRSINPSYEIAGQEKHMIERFTDKMKNVEMITRKKTIWRGLINSITQTIPYASFGIGLYYGGTLVSSGDTHYKCVMR